MMDAFDELGASSNPGSPPKQCRPNHVYLSDSAPKRLRTSPGSGSGHGLPVAFGSLEFRDFKAHVADASRTAHHETVIAATAGGEPAAADLVAPERTRRFAEFSVAAQHEDEFQDGKWAAAAFCCCVCATVCVVQLT